MKIKKMSDFLDEKYDMIERLAEDRTLKKVASVDKEAGCPCEQFGDYGLDADDSGWQGPKPEVEIVKGPGMEAMHESMGPMVRVMHGKDVMDDLNKENGGCLWDKLSDMEGKKIGDVGELFPEVDLFDDEDKEGDLFDRIKELPEDEMSIGEKKIEEAFEEFWDKVKDIGEFGEDDEDDEKGKELEKDKKAVNGDDEKKDDEKKKKANVVRKVKVIK